MLTDTDLQLWLETGLLAAQSKVVVYLRSTRNTELDYRLTLLKSGRHSQSKLAQRGLLTLVAGESTSVSQLTISLAAGEQCNIELVTREGEKAAIPHHFDCLQKAADNP